MSTLPACPVDAFVPHLLALWRERYAAGRAAARGPRPILPPGRLTGPELYEAAAAVRELSRGFTRERGLAGAGYMDEPDLLGGYLLFYWTVSFAQTWAALASAGLLGPGGLRARRVLDLGAGPCPSSLALLAAGAGRVLAVDRSAAALALGAEVARRTGRRLETRVADVTGGAVPDGPFDLVISVHAMNELWSDRDDRIERRRTLLAAAGRRLAPGGRVLLVDPALTATANEAIALRDALAVAGWQVLSPCTRRGACPALPDGTCHADVAWEPPPAVQRIGHAARIGRESLAFSYFLFSPPGAGAASGPARHRVVSERFLAKSGRHRVLVCGPEGRFPLSVDARASFPSARTFRTLGRYDLVRVEGTERRATGWGLLPESALRVDARAPSLAARQDEGRRGPPRRRRPQGGPPHRPQGGPPHRPQGGPPHRPQGGPPHRPQGGPPHRPPR